MTNTLKYTLFFLGGLVLGGGAGYVSAKMILEKKYEERFVRDMAEMEEYYQKTDSYKREMVFEDEAEVNPSGQNNNTDRSRGVLSEEVRNEIKEKLIRNYETTSNYASIYKEAHPDVFENNGSGASAELLREDSDEELDEAQKATLEHQQYKNDPPKIISADEYDALPPHIDTKTLYFYHDDETLLDDNDDVIEDPAVLIGNALNDSDFIDNIGEPMMFVYNPALDTAYEIQRVEGAYYG